MPPPEFASAATSGRNIDFTAVAADKGVHVSPGKPTSPTPIGISVHPAGRNPGFYQSEIAVTAQDGNTAKIKINLFILRAGVIRALGRPNGRTIRQ